MSYGKGNFRKQVNWSLINSHILPISLRTERYEPIRSQSQSAVKNLLCAQLTLPSAGKNVARAKRTLVTGSEKGGKSVDD